MSVREESNIEEAIRRGSDEFWTRSNYQRG